MSGEPGPATAERPPREAPERTPPAEDEATASRQDAARELRCTLCGLRACWTGPR